MFNFIKDNFSFESVDSFNLRERSGSKINFSKFKKKSENVACKKTEET
jgi:hypothetical protein